MTPHVLILAALLSPPETRPARVLHFPTDRSVGSVSIQDADLKREIADFYHWVDGTTEWEYVGEAKGDVAVPARKRVRLQIYKAAIKNLDFLAKLRPDDVHALSFEWNRGDPGPDERAMQNLSRLTGLKVLHMRGVRVRTGFLKHIKALESLEQIYLPYQTDNDGLAEVCELPRLTGLYVEGTRITSAGLQHLTKLRFLEELAVPCRDRAGIAHIAALKSLKYLCCGLPSSPEGIAELRKLPSLKILAPWGDATDQKLRGVAQLHTVENLMLYSAPITDAGIAHLRGMPALKKLNVGRFGVDVKVTDKSLEYLKDIPSLEHLTLPNIGITDRGMAHIPALAGLKYLWVSCGGDSPLSDDSLRCVGKLRLLEELHIYGKHFTDTGMEYIAGLANLKDLHLGTGSRVTQSGLRKLTAFKSLNRLDLHFDEQQISISSISALSELPNLTSLTVWGITQDNTALNLAGLLKLERLSLQVLKSGSKIRDEDLACLANMKSLKWVSLPCREEESAVSDAGLACLANLESLGHLGVGGSGVTDVGLTHIAGLKRLGSLSVGGKITDQGLRQLEGLEHLERLHVYTDNKIGPAAVKRLKGTLPHLLSVEIAPMTERPPTPKAPGPPRTKSPPRARR